MTRDETLRALIAQWRAEQARYPVDTDERAVGAAAAVRLCAYELEAALGDPIPTTDTGFLARTTSGTVFTLEPALAGPDTDPAPASDWQPTVERLTQERDEARDTNQRLNRRCQIADAAVHTKVEQFEQRSKHGLRAYYFNMGKASAEAQVEALTLQTLQIRQVRDEIQGKVTALDFNGSAEALLVARHLEPFRDRLSALLTSSGVIKDESQP